MAGHNHSVPNGKHNLDTPPELLDIRRAMRKGKPLPDGVTSDRGVYRPRESLLERLYAYVRPRRGCGCKQREKRWNSVVPYSGTAFRWFTTLTGLKSIWGWWTAPRESPRR